MYFRLITIAGIVLIVIGFVGLAITAPIVIQDSIPTSEYSLTAPPTTVTFENTMYVAEYLFMLITILGWGVALYGVFSKPQAQKKEFTFS